MQKKGMTGIIGTVIGVGIAAVVAVICVQIYNSIYTTSTITNGTCGEFTACINGTSKTVAQNIPVFIFLGLLVAAALFFAFK